MPAENDKNSLEMIPKIYSELQLISQKLEIAVISIDKRVKVLEVDVSEIKEKQATCPARLDHDGRNPLLKIYASKKLTAVLASIGTLVAGILTYLGLS